MNDKENPEANIISIYDVIPKEQGGRSARQGHDYQDHVGANFCIRMLNNVNLIQIWIESLDDITAIYNDDPKFVVELIQVKSHDRSSRWSVNSITDKDNPNTDSSIVEKAIMRCTFNKEKIIFRLVTKIDVTKELEVMKYELGSDARKKDLTNIEKLKDTLKNKIGMCKSPTGIDVEYWVENCYWDKKPDSTKALANENRLYLESMLKDVLQQILFPDQRDELYQQLVGLVYKASKCNCKADPACFKIEREKFISWLREQIQLYRYPNTTHNKLVEKLKKAGVDEIEIENAKELKLKYLKERLQPDYVQISDLNIIEGEIQGALQLLRLSLDDGSLQLSEIDFVHKCLTEVKNIIEKYNNTRNFNVPIHLGYGYMYDLADKCLHRFLCAGS